MVENIAFKRVNRNFAVIDKLELVHQIFSKF